MTIIAGYLYDCFGFQYSDSTYPTWKKDCFSKEIPRGNVWSVNDVDNGDQFYIDNIRPLSEIFQEKNKCLEVVNDPCPNCGTQLICQSGGGVACPKKGCGYWFCY